MPVLRYVDIYPPTGNPDLIWNEDQMGRENTPEVWDALARSSRPVSELYSEAIASLALQARYSELRVAGCDLSRYPPTHATLKVREGRDGPCEWAFLHVPPSVGWLSARQRAELALDAFHLAALELADIRGFDATGLEGCRAHVVDADFVYRWDSPWKAGPDRRWRARTRFELTPDDGFGRVRLEVAPRPSPREPEDAESAEPAVSSEPAIAFCTGAGFRRSASTLRWHSPSQVSVNPDPYRGFLRDTGRVTATRSSTDDWAFEMVQAVRVRTPRPADVLGAPPGEPVMPRIEVERIT